MKFSESQMVFVNALEKSEYKDNEKLTSVMVDKICADSGISFPAWIRDHSTGNRGEYKNPLFLGKILDLESEQFVININIPVAGNISIDSGRIPAKSDFYVQNKNYKKLLRIVETKMFFPVFISGPKGCGKNKLVEQVCAENNREFFRVNITSETSEDDLIGGFRLIGGNTIWQDGPVIEAMKSGGILMLDELCLGSSKIMCLQPILEGSSYLIKKTGEVVHPKPGFNVIVGDNTKGFGSDDGMYSFTNIMNGAFMDRFSIMIEHNWPTESEEKRILKKYIPDDLPENIAKLFDQLISDFVQWANKTREAYDNEVHDNFISIRKNIDLLKTFLIFKDKNQAVNDICAFFDPETREGFLDLWKAISKGES